MDNKVKLLSNNAWIANKHAHTNMIIGGRNTEAIIRINQHKSQQQQEQLPYRTASHHRALRTQQVPTLDQQVHH